MMKRKTILIVPPRGTRVRAIRVHLSVAILFFVVAIGGLAGYFIPFNSFSVDVVRQNQKKNLSEQNRKLLQRIISTLHLLNNLKEQVRKLEQKQESVIEITGENHAIRHRRKKIDFYRMSPRALLALVEQRQEMLESFAKVNGSNNTVFDRIPVIVPVPGNPAISKVFGISKDPFTGKEKFHYGVDFIAELETPVLAAAAGTVTRLENNPVWGKRIMIDHGRGYTTVYAHLGGTRASQGKQVRRGEIIGSIGISGLTTGPHLHYEVWRDGKAVNPDEYFFPVRTARGEPGNKQKNGT